MSSCHDEHSFGMAFAAWGRFTAEGNEAGIVVLDGLDALSQYFHLVQFGSSFTCYGGNASKVFFTNHFGTAGSVVGGDDLDAQFAQVLVTLGQSLGVGDYAVN